MSGDTLERRANFRHDFSFHNWRWDAYHFFFQGNVHSEFIDYDIIFFRCSLASYANHAFGQQYQYGQEALHV